MRFLGAFVIAVALSAAAAAGPLTTEELFNEFHLFGNWALDCKREAAPDNPHVTITMPSPGVIIEDHDLGTENAVNRYSVLSAQKLSDTRLAVQVIFQPGRDNEERQKLVWAFGSGSRRTMFTQPEDGPVRVKDGVAVTYGVATPVLHKCE